MDWSLLLPSQLQTLFGIQSHLTQTIQTDKDVAQTLPQIVADIVARPSTTATPPSSTTPALSTPNALALLLAIAGTLGLMRYWPYMKQRFQSLMTSPPQSKSKSKSKSKSNSKAPRHKKRA
jgi:hypothetical protein